jgi:hypothetical protein
LARSHTEAAINVLTGIMNQSAAADSARVAAANSLLDRGWGKAAQPVTGGDDEDSPVRIERIERVIVDPANPDGEGV